MSETIRVFMSDEEGATAVEYGLIVAILGGMGACIASLGIAAYVGWHFMMKCW